MLNSNAELLFEFNLGWLNQWLDKLQTIYSHSLNESQYLVTHKVCLLRIGAVHGTETNLKIKPVAKMILVDLFDHFLSDSFSFIHTKHQKEIKKYLIDWIWDTETNLNFQRWSSICWRWTGQHQWKEVTRRECWFSSSDPEFMWSLGFRSCSGNVWSGFGNSDTWNGQYSCPLEWPGTQRKSRKLQKWCMYPMTVQS